MNIPPEWAPKPTGRAMQEIAEADSSCCSSSTECTTGRPPITRIATSSAHAQVIQPYLDEYNDHLARDGKTASNVQLMALPSTEELFTDIRYDLKSRSGLYDGFITPPSLMGDLMALEGIATLSSSGRSATVGNLSDVWNDLLPYYKDHVSSLDGKIRGIPLRAGNQPLLLYRSDYLEAFDLPVPVTWGEYIRVAATLHNATLAEDGSEIYGSCLGRISEAMCRRQMNQRSGQKCTSMSTTYIGMMLASMTQYQGSSTGWLFDGNVDNGMESLLDPALESVLVYMEQQLRFGAPNELQSDESLNRHLFEQGKCAMTIVWDHSILGMTESSGFAKVPGSHMVLNREDNTIIECSEALCPYGEQNDDWGTVNHAPFGAQDMMVGSISTFASKQAEDAIYDFFLFVTQSRDLDVAGEREQPLSYVSTGLQDIFAHGYKEIILDLTESPNAASPFRTPHAFSLLSEIDNQVYEYLSQGNFSQDRRQYVRERVESSLQRMVRQHDAISPAVPTSILYEKSLGTFTPVKSPDVYIGRASRVIGWSFGGFSCFCSLLFAFWVWRNKRSSVVLSSQPMFLNLICLGTLLMAGCIFLFGVEDDIASTAVTSGSCMGSMWLYSFGYVIIVTALSSKIWLINRIFRKAKNLQRIRVGWVDIMLPLLTIGGINLIILITWNIQDPIVWERAPVEEPANTLGLEEVATYGFCNSENFRVYFGMLVGVNYVFSVVALIQAYECRKISTDYLESLWISASLGCIVQVWSVGLPLLKLLDDDPRAVFFVKVVIAFLTAMCPLMLIFLPKIRYTQEPQRRYVQGNEPAPITYGDHSITSNDSDTSPTKDRSKYGKVAGLSASERVSGKDKDFSGLEGIRIIQMSNRHGEEVDKLQRSLRRAESRHRSLNERLERLQEKFEHHLVSRHPHHEFQDSSRSGNNFILSARSEHVDFHTSRG